MTPLAWLILVIVCLLVIGWGVYHTERKYNDAERKYSIRPPRKHWWQP